MTHRLPLLLLTAICLPFFAQTVTVAAKSEKELTLRLLACEISKDPVKVILETNDSRSEVIDLPSSAFSEPLVVSGRAVKLKVPDSEIPPCDITFPAEGDSFSVVLAPQEPSGFVPIVLGRDDDSFKAGDYYFVNGSAHTLVLNIGGTELVLEAGSAAKARPTEPVNNNHYNIIMSTRSESGDKVIASTRWPMVNPNRSYIIFQTNASGRTSYRAIDETVDRAGGGK